MKFLTLIAGTGLDNPWNEISGSQTWDLGARTGKTYQEIAEQGRFINYNLGL